MREQAFGGRDRSLRRTVPGDALQDRGAAVSGLRAEHRRTTRSAHNNERAWEVFKRWDKPFLTLFSSRDPITRGGERVWQKLVPGAQGQPHTTIRGAGHFLQEDKGPEIARAIADLIRATPRK